MRVIDADGHIRENHDEIAKFMPNGSRDIFPALDHLHGQHFRKSRSGAGVAPDASEWVEFLDETGVDWTVMYPTSGLAIGRVIDPEWAIAACQAYNNWVYEQFVRQSPRLAAMALLPLQDVSAAVDELHRAVGDLGMSGGMLASNGEGLKAHLGDLMFWPIYEAAQKLGCPLAVHGGSHHRLAAVDTFSTFYGAHALGHPLTVMIQMVGMLTHGVFDQFPGLRVAYLEGGAGWVPFIMDRLDRSYPSHLQDDREGNPVPGSPRPGEKASEYFRRHVREGRIYVGFDVDDESLGYAVQRAGAEPFLFATDFPHENTSAEFCRHEIDELLERSDIGESAKAALLAENAVRFYGRDALSV